MQTQRAATNPFAMMLDPQAVLAKLASSDRLDRLERRICRPLDKPLIGQVSAEDAAIDGDADSSDGDSGDDVSSAVLLQRALAPSTAQ